MSRECDCEVCVALSGVRLEDLLLLSPEELADFLDTIPRSTARILIAQARIARDMGTDDDETLVKEAAARCRGSQFPRRPRH